MKNTSLSPNRISTYFRSQTRELLVITICGLIYNLGLLLSPFLEGKMVQCLLDILQEKVLPSAMARLALLYCAIVAVVQFCRYLKRLYVRKFGNNINRQLKTVLFRNLAAMSKKELDEEGAGKLMTKAISDADVCSEGMRKFTTEVFDTGIALAGYIGLLLYFDYKLALISLIFPPFAYLMAEKMKYSVQRTGAESKKSAEKLNSATLDRIENGITYRIFSAEKNADRLYEEKLEDYRKKQTAAGIRIAAMPPLYHAISMVSVIFIISIGSRSIQQGVWDIAAFTAFLSCFGKLSVKSSKAAKLFNSVHKAQVSWERIQPMLKMPPELPGKKTSACSLVRAEKLGKGTLFQDLSFEAKTGTVIGITGPIACGKSTLGKAFLWEEPYDGEIFIDEKPLSSMPEEEKRSFVTYLGHDPELLSDTIRTNILLGSRGEPLEFARLTALDREILEFPQKEDTFVGSGGVILSGGQQQRLALTRTLAHSSPILVLDDPFSALDKATEEEIFRNLQEFGKDKILFLISHRLYSFPQMDQVIWLNDGKARISTHQELLKTEPLYETLWKLQQKGGSEHEAY